MAEIEDSRISQMNDAAWETRVAELANSFSYPETPSISSHVAARMRADRQPIWGMGRRWAVAGAAIVLAVALIAMATPQARAVLLDMIRLGAVRIFLVEPTPGSEALSTVTPMPVTPVATPSVPESSGVTSTREAIQESYRTPAGETTLQAAGDDLGFALRMPTYPPELGDPDEVYRYSLIGETVIFVWFGDGPRGEERGENPRLALYQLGSDAIFQKLQPTVIEETEVAGESALWTTGPYLVSLENGSEDFQQLVTGHALIWTEGDVTYRLEAGGTLEDAVRIAESLTPMQP